MQFQVVLAAETMGYVRARTVFVQLLSLVASVGHVLSEPLDTAKVCQYMQCTDDGSRLTLQFNNTLWKALNRQSNVAFDLTSWNWAELDSVVEENRTFEIIFNGLEIPLIDISQGHESVTILNLDDNQITTVEPEAFMNFKNMVTLSLRGNMITVVNELVYQPNSLQHLDLSNNWITDIKGLKTFTLSRLTHLNLSYNRLESVRTELSKLEALETLDLSHNSIRKGDRPIILPQALRRLLLHHNELTEWPFESLPYTLTDLSLSFNRLELTKDAPDIRKLDLSSNRLASFCGDCFPLLEELDLSSNYFEEFPKFGKLTGATIRKVSFNRMPNLRTLDKSAFEDTEHLQELEISFCPRLATIASHTFTGLKELERLDLSYNALQQVPEDMINWKAIKQGVDLQGNPINCNCSMQWLVDKVIPAMHSHRELHKLFPELRCAQPAMYKDYLVAYLTVHDNLLCLKYREMNLPGMELVVQSMKEQRQMQIVRAQKIILACLIVGIIFMSLCLAYVKLQQPRHIVRPLYYS
ncbi:leucine-rich repeat neuronal protein 1-like [Anopheles stephensi]|uniref:leucine-rich repeat neuronal protein 1-like n=1 Tax=Anopheles stephensi TaxID=30069 RepID=UPI001658AAB4|nr:leucine-rich repeat neuronal protein 1-like [Anopheles stephensi]